MAPITQSNQQQTGTKRPRYGGRPTQITPEIVQRVAARVVSGLPLRYALALETPVISVAHWLKSLDASPKLEAIYSKKIGEGLEAMIEKIRSAECLRKMPPDVWILERRFREHFGQQREQGNFIINQTLIGVSNDIAARAAELVRRKTPKPEPISQGVRIADGANGCAISHPDTLKALEIGQKRQ